MDKCKKCSVKEMAYNMSKKRMPYSLDKINKSNKYKLVCEFHHGPFMVFEDSKSVDMIDYIENARENSRVTITYETAMSIVTKWWNYK